MSFMIFMVPPKIDPVSDVTRHAGVMAPQFSLPSSRSWGIGELPDLGPPPTSIG
jgi:hypothetical protein